jgi:hypothetical protein
MKTNSSAFRVTMRLAVVMMLMAACNVPVAPATESPETTQIPTQGEPTAAPEATATESEQAPPGTATSSPPAAPTATTTGPRCTVLQDLNLRTGPGTAYNPPITALPASTELIPLAYNPVGIPGGSWVQVRTLQNERTGWVSAGAQYVSCNIDLTTLDSVTVAPPEPQRPLAQTSNPDGTCGEGGIPDEQQLHVYDCDARFANGLPVQFLVFKDGQEASQNDGVQNVVFRVEQNGNTIYTNTEETAAYCMFGGDDPCNAWVLEDFVYKWESGGERVQAGDYIVNIDATVEDPFVTLHWDAEVTITLE